MRSTKGFFNKSATKAFLNKTKMVLNINKVLYFCKSTFVALMNENRFSLHGQHGHACRTADAEPNFCRFSNVIGRYCCNFTFNIRTMFINRRWLVGIDHVHDVAHICHHICHIQTAKIRF